MKYRFEFEIEEDTNRPPAEVEAEMRKELDPSIRNLRVYVGGNPALRALFERWRHRLGTLELPSSHAKSLGKDRGGFFDLGWVQGVNAVLDSIRDELSR
jgi:hypothetical protein